MAIQINHPKHFQLGQLYPDVTVPAAAIQEIKIADGSKSGLKEPLMSNTK
jgi:hypothetical protein